MNKTWNKLENLDVLYCIPLVCLPMQVLFPHHVNQLGDLEAKADSDGVVGVLDGSHPLLVAPEEVPQQGILHLSQRHKVFLSLKDSGKKATTRTRDKSIELNIHSQL